jgi:signal transduction histidine kinase
MVQREAERARHGGDDDIFSIEYRMQHKDGSWRWLLSREIILNRMPDGRSRQVIGIAQDVTERKRLADQSLALELEKSRVDLLREFMTTTSHELRTPLTVISSSAYVISRTQDEARRQEKLLSIHDQIQRMALILDQFSSLLEIQSGDFEMRPVDVHHLLSQAEAVEHASIIAKRLTIDRQFEAGPIRARGDRAYLQTAVSQLLQNAVRHTPPQGRIALRTRVDRHEVIVEIEDSGPGIEPESQPRVFELFYKANPGRTTDTSGAGIGLAMVKRIVEAHQGRVSICSEIGRGTNFSMVLPASDTAAPALPEAG